MLRKKAAARRGVEKVGKELPVSVPFASVPRASFQGHRDAFLTLRGSVMVIGAAAVVLCGAQTVNLGLAKPWLQPDALRAPDHFCRHHVPPGKGCDPSLRFLVCVRELKPLQRSLPSWGKCTI